MSIHRVYAAPHKGLRNLLSKFIQKAGVINYKDQNELYELKLLGKDLFTLLENHAETENTKTLVYLDERVHGSSAKDREDHIRIGRLQKVLENKLIELDSLTSEQDAHQFYLECTYFQSQYLLHIYEEETKTEQLIRSNFTQSELELNHKNTLLKIDFEILLLWMKYIFEVQSKEENLKMLDECKHLFPPHKFVQIMDIARQMLGEQNFTYLLIQL